VPLSIVVRRGGSKRSIAEAWRARVPGAEIVGKRSQWSGVCAPWRLHYVLSHHAAT